MIFKTINGKTKDVSLIPYLIDWEPKKEVSKPQGQVKAFLKPYWQHKTVCEEFRIPGSKYRIDIFAPMEGPNKSGVVIEVSPSATHTQYNKFMHGSLSGYVSVLKRDMIKQRWAELNGFTYVEITDKELNAGLTTEWFEQTFGIIL